MGTPPFKTKEQLREMDYEDLLEYAYDRQEAAYTNWENMMGNNL